MKRVRVARTTGIIGVFGLVWIWLSAIAWLSNHQGELQKTRLFQLIFVRAPVPKQQDRHEVLRGDAKSKEQRQKQQKKDETKMKTKKQKPAPPQKQLHKQRRAKKNVTEQNFYTLPSYALPLHPMGWREFVRDVKSSFASAAQVDISPAYYTALEKHLHMCSKELVDNVTRPMLSKEAFDFCKWALDDGPEGGQVVVGKSFGVLKGPEREKYERYYCNSVSGGRNPSCDDAFGDEQIRSWRSNPVSGLCSPPGEEEDTYTSNLHCVDSRSRARFCTLENSLMDLSKMHSIHRPGSTDSRRWDEGFLSSHCSPKLRGKKINYYELYAPQVDPETTMCDYVFNETVIVVSQDQSKNLGHTMNDFMNTWAALWLAGVGSHTGQITLLNVDAVREGHNYNDELFQFGLHYAMSFNKVMKISSFPPNAKACFKRLIFLPRPYLLFTWDGWWQDMPCPRLGPSALFQRWNLQVRESYGLLRPNALTTNRELHVLLVVRVVSSQEEEGNPHFNSRVFVNQDEIRIALGALLNEVAITHPAVPTRLTVTNLGELGFAEQIKLVSSASVLVGMHGAGITHAMHQPIGTKFCCGVLEVFPYGEFAGIRGHGNMARRMGHHYDRIFLGKNNTNAPRFRETGPGFGGYVPIAQLNQSMRGVLAAVLGERRTCLMPQVLRDPFFEADVPPSKWA